MPLKERLVHQGYNKKLINQQFSKVNTIDRNELLNEKTNDKEIQNTTPLVLTYKRFLPNISYIVRSTGTYLILAEHFKGYSKKN